MEYELLRQQFPTFYYHDFTIVESEKVLQIHYDYEIKGLSHFNPEFTFAKPAGCGYLGNLRTVREAAFSLGMAEMASYWKLTCSPEIIVECGALDAYQTSWWEKLCFLGFREFFKQNHIKADRSNFMQLISVGDHADGDWDDRKFHGTLIPVGGGKDSLVTLEALKPIKEDNAAFVVGHVRCALNTARAAGYDGEQLVGVERSLDPRMLDFNKQGYLNGSIPFSALLAFGAALCAILYGKKYICFSNESTSSDPSADPQYARTFAFEKSFDDYMNRYVTGQVHCFSLLRPINSLMVSGIFASLKQYHPIFLSCNKGMKEEKWCGHCPKCLFTSVMMSAYLSHAEVVGFMHCDPLNDASMKELFFSMCGNTEENAKDHGAFSEFNTAASMAIALMKKRNEPVPILLQEYEKSALYPCFEHARVDWSYWNEENLVPKTYQDLLRKLIEKRRDDGLDR